MAFKCEVVWRQTNCVQVLVCGSECCTAQLQEEKLFWCSGLGVGRFMTKKLKKKEVWTRPGLATHTHKWTDLPPHLLIINSCLLCSERRWASITFCCGDSRNAFAHYRPIIRYPHLAGWHSTKLTQIRRRSLNDCKLRNIYVHRGTNLSKTDFTKTIKTIKNNRQSECTQETLSMKRQPLPPTRSHE